MRYGARIWAPAVLGLGMIGATIGLPKTLWAAAKRPAAQAHASKTSTRTSRGTKHISTKTIAGRHRKGTVADEPDGPLAGEKAGGTGGRATAHKTKKALSSRSRVAAVHRASKRVCMKDPVIFERGFGGEVQSLVLTRCNGVPAPKVVEQMSILIRPLGVAVPTVITTPVRHGVRQEWLPGIKLTNRGLVMRVQKVADHFRGKRLVIVSGYRPRSEGSLHQLARALDFHVDGVTNKSLVAFCKTLPDTGCGYYPNSSFIHMDVRPSGTGKVFWIDASGPGEPPRYVASWPPKTLGGRLKEIPKPDPAAPQDEQTHPDSMPPLPPGASDMKVDANTTVPDVFRP
jgi:Bacterial protein of unknown function (DUF882)